VVLGTKSLNPAVFEILRSKRIGVSSLPFQAHVTSSVTWPFDSSDAISYWLSFGRSLYLTVSEIFNVECHLMSRSFILVPIDTTSYTLAIVTFALGRTV